MASQMSLGILSLMAVSTLCHAGSDNVRMSYSPTQYLKNYALSACIADGYRVEKVARDASASANGYKELGSLDIEAYNEVLTLVERYLAKEYQSQSGEQLVAMKCIDLYHSQELDQLAQRYTTAE